MAILVSNQNVSARVGNRQVGPVTLPQGTRTLLLRMESDTWPVTSDGTVTVTLQVSRKGGAYVREFADSFDHSQIRHAGVVQDFCDFTATLAAPFGANDALRAQVDSTVAFNTRVSVEVI